MFFIKLKLFLVVLLFPFFTFSQQVDSLQIKIGQMIMIGLSGTAVDITSSFYKDVKAGKLGGITMYESNLTATNSAENLRAMIAAYQGAASIPLFVAITQEGGLVNRLKTKYGFPSLPSAKYLGKLDNIDSTKRYADSTAHTLSKLGINVNFAPVVDVYMASNPVLGSRERTYSNDYSIIIKHALQVIRSHNNYKVVTVLKHFPGHGTSTTDSHLGMTDVSKTWTKDELEPYRQIINKGEIKAVMTAHIINDQLDESRLPATLSKKIITGVLRGQLKFKGVVFSDDMHMKAISAEYGLKHAIELAINAGVDVLLFSGNIPGVTSNGASAIVDLILELVHEGKVSTEQVNNAYRRIMHLKSLQARVAR